MDRNKPFEIEKTFGLGVLLKLTKKYATGVEIATCGNKFTSNLSLSELNDAVNRVMQAHNIHIKIQ